MKYKKLSIVFFIILIFFLLPNFCLASFSVNNNGDIINLPDLPIDTINSNVHYIIVYNTYGYHFYYYIGDDFSHFVIAPNWSAKVINGVKETGETITNGMYLSDYNSESDTWGDARAWKELSGYDTAVLKGNENVYNPDGTIFFRPAPVGKLGEIVEKTPTQETLLQIVKILPMILVVVVSFLGLRKCWRLLSMLLHQA